MRALMNVTILSIITPLLLSSEPAPRRREASSEQRDHRSQQPPDGGQAHHREATRGQCKSSVSDRLLRMMFPLNLYIFISRKPNNDL